MAIMSPLIECALLTSLAKVVGILIDRVTMAEGVLDCAAVARGVLHRVVACSSMLLWR